MHSGLADRHGVVVFRHIFFDAAIKKLVLEEEDRVVVADGGLDQPFGITGRGRRDNFHSRRVDKMHLGILRVERPAVHAAAAGSAQDERSRRAPAIMRLGHHVHDLIKSAADEVHELEFRHGTHAGKRRAKRRAHNGRLGDGRIDHALRAKVVDKAVRDFERAAVNTDVFTDTEDGGVGLHLFQSPCRIASRYVA